MRITHDFAALWRIVEELGAEKASFSLKRTSSIPQIESQLLRGREVKLADLENVAGLLAIEGRQVLLYIPDQGKNILEVLAGNRDLGKKFHVAHCKTLENMKSAGRFERYIATTNVSGDFELTGTMDFKKETKGTGRLYVCQNCLNMLNYKQCKIEGSARKLRETFDLTQFFETYSSCFSHLPSRTRVDAGRSTYTANWSEISKGLRSTAQWHCSECRVDLSAHKHLLHVHHKDGVKGNNHDANLQVLCKACHRQQPLHDHLYVPLSEMKLINSLRKAAGSYRSDWASILKYADPACHGVLGLAKQSGWPTPEIEHPIASGQNPVEIAWPSRKLAISLAGEMPKNMGWRVLDLAAANLYFST